MNQEQKIKKAKTTVYMSDSDETLLHELFIKRLRDRNKTDMSKLLCEGLRLLYENEITRSNENAEKNQK
ncbi:MAG: hypothetical protein P4L31_07765 [Candidatus Babeliales bacterium]|nr:hypothetical protein [Candidatus Babeliales bacterium]